MSFITTLKGDGQVTTYTCRVFQGKRKEAKRKEKGKNKSESKSKEFPKLARSLLSELVPSAANKTPVYRERILLE